MGTVRSLMKARLLLPLLAAVMALAVPSAAAAAPASTSFAITGYEYAFTQTVGSFAGTGTGNAGERAVWNATVQHDPLGSSPTYVNGGSFQLGTLSPTTGHVDYVTGTVGYHSGMITTLNSGPSCTNQQYRVMGGLEDVRTSTTSGGSGSFDVTLTHFRYSFFGHCVIYKASVKGVVALTY
jgi:hypothetical protein